MLLPLIIIAVFIGIGLLLIKKAEHIKMQDSEITNNNDLENDTSQVIDEKESHH